MQNKFKYLLILLTCIFFNLLQAQDKKAALLYPQNTINLKTENSNWLIDNYYRWELFLIQNKIEFEVVSEQQIAEGLENKFSLLIMPCAKKLSDEEIASLNDFIKNGNSVLATMSLGVYNSDNNWRGWQSFEQIFGIKFIDEVNAKFDTRIHTIFGETPISTNIPAGFRLQVTTYDRPIEVKANSPYTYSAGYWQNSDIPFEGKLEGNNTTSMVFGSNGKGKFAWFGFEISAVVGAKIHLEAANNLFSNAINWLNDKPIVQIAIWPNGKNCAAVFSCDVEFKFNLVNNALDLLEEENVPAQFYVLAESIDLQSFQRLSKMGEIGLHGDKHDVFKFEDLQTQQIRLLAGIQSIEKLLNKKPISFRPPETLYDDNTLQAMKYLNLNILASDYIEDRSVPQFSESYPQLLIIPKTGFDDYDIFYRLKLTSIDSQAERYILDFNRVYEEGGLYNLYFHTQMQCKKEYVEALRKPIQTIKSKNVWIANHTQIFNWWNIRKNLRVSLEQIEDDSFDILIENQNNIFVDDAAIIIFKKTLSSSKNILISLNGKSLDFTIDSKFGKIFMLLPKLAPKEITKLKVVID